MKYVLDDVVTSYSRRMSSHKSGWTRVLRSSLTNVWADTHEFEIAFSDDSLETVLEADSWLIAHPMDFAGEAYNLFGGWNAEVKARVARLLEVKDVASLERPMPNLRTILEPRARKTDINFTDSEWRKIEDVCMTMQTIDPFAYAPGVVLGDSHSVASYRPGYRVLRNDGLTLHGLLKRGIANMLPDGDIRHLIISAGNIDVRHHIGRHGDYIEEIRRLQDELIVQLARLEIPTSVVALYPVEHEGRRLPKTGWFKGTPFFLPREQRANAVKFFNTRMPGAVEDWPPSWYTMDPEEYAKLYMEKPGSVHLSPAWHRWDYANDRRHSITGV